MPLTLDFSYLEKLDNELSNRFIELDPQGYFIIYLDREKGLICAKHYTNAINENGLAVDPDTGEVIACQGNKPRLETQEFTGRTAKEICVKLFEETIPPPVSKFDHACYLGREFMRAEFALKTGEDYIQD
jgi:dihydropteroate synthase